MLAHCGSIHEDDGVDPREFFKTGGQREKENRKAKQLCRQVAETLGQVLSGEMGDEVLRGLRVASVVPAPDSSRLLVTLCVERSPEPFDRTVVERKLAACQGRLRGEVAAAITRRKAPALAFAVINLEGAESRTGGEDLR
jgi:ribosome-binding factor A